LLLLILMVAVGGLSVLAGAVGVPYPIVLVLGGLVLGFVPGLAPVELAPELVLVLFLPPLLFQEAFSFSPRELRANARPIALLAVGLVLATMTAVAAVAHALVSGLPWAAAFTLGAIVSPTDPLAATTILRRLGLPRPMVAVVEGESLVNDATALVAYRLAVAAVVAGGFSLWQAGAWLVAGAAGGVAIGLAVGWLLAQALRRIQDPMTQIVLSVVAGYGAYLPADRLGLSGVLAAVTAGLYLGWRAPQLTSPTTRLLGVSFWQVLVYLLNAVLFVLVGLQLHPILNELLPDPITVRIGHAAAVSAVVIAVRLGWGHTLPSLFRALDQRPTPRTRRASPSEQLVAGWSGMRGAVSLAAALALPLTTSTGQPFPHRHLIIFLTFAVILATLVGQGLTLPWLIHRLGLPHDHSQTQEELRGRLRATDAALARLDELATQDWTHNDTVTRMRGLYQHRRQHLTTHSSDPDNNNNNNAQDHSLADQRLAHELLEAQRREIALLRNQGQISNQTMSRIEHDLDLEDTQLQHWETPNHPP
jgi:CPA1 family monovalent cation:H+ antiporter